MNKSLWITLSTLTIGLFAVFVSFPTGGAQAQNISLPPSILDESRSDQLPPIVPGVVLVGLKPGTVAEDGLSIQAGDTSLNDTLATFGVQDIDPVFPGITQQSLSVTSASNSEIDLSRIFRLRLPSDADVLRTVEELRAHPAIAYAEPDYLAHIIATPNDPHFSGQWPLTRINAPAAWDVVTGTPDVVIAVVDSGLDTSHPDLAGQLWVNPGEIAGNGLDDDSNGYVDDIHGWNILENNANLSDNTGHGTEVAGVIAATSNNGIGVSGVCWNCRLMVVKVAQVGGIANYSDIAAGVAYAAQKGAKVINLSLGGYSDSVTLRTAIEAASQTAVIVGGSGNDNKNDRFYPAAYENYVLSVAGTTTTDTKVGTSNYGEWVDVAAPGEAIMTTFSGGGYGSASGTSMAAPFASGLAGLIRSLHPDWSANLAKAQIFYTADNIDSLNPGYEGQLGTGRIDAGQATTTLPAAIIQFVDYAANGQTNGALKTGTTNSVVVRLRNDWLDASTVSATLSTTSNDVSVTKATSTWGAIASGQLVTNSANPLRVSVPAGKYGLTVPFTLNVVADGVASTLTFTATTESQNIIVGGLVTTHTTWLSDRTYIATSNVFVTKDITLTIQPGTVIKFNPGVMLEMHGTLIADGTSAQPIRFTSNAANPQPGSWGNTCNGVYPASLCFTPDTPKAQFDASGNYQGGPVIRHAIIEYGQGIQTSSGVPFIDHNLIWKNAGHFIIYRYSGTPDSPLVISNNRIISNTGRLEVGDYILSQNLIANNKAGNAFDPIISLYTLNGFPRTVISNTIIGNISNGGGLCNGTSISTLFCLDVPGYLVEMTGNNILANQAGYDVALRQDPFQPMSIADNFWGTTDPTAIASRIFDLYGRLNFNPFLTQPEPTAPPFLYQLSLSPTSPVGIQQVTFDLTFSRPMDQSINPVLTFGFNSPYDTYTVTDNAQWLNETHWRATYNITSLVPQGILTIYVSGARSTDGIEIAPDTRFNFAVDYAGQITDQTPPRPPEVSVITKGDDASYVGASWEASDPDSHIIGYRYAVGSAPGATDIVNWTAVTASSFSRSGLGLGQDRQYWVAVQAQNIGGLWSPSGYKAFIAGQEVSKKTFLPLILKQER